MKTYALYLESGPKRKKTMVHVLELSGCMANGPTTEDALAATPGAIRDYLRFLKRHGEAVYPDAAFETRVAEHITQGDFLGSGAAQAIYGPDFEPLAEAEIEPLLARSGWLREAMASWVETQTDEQLDAAPDVGGRTARAVISHVLPIGYLSPVLGPGEGLSSLAHAAERGEVLLPYALREIGARNADRVRAATPEQRAAVVQRPEAPRTLRKAVRRMLEHDWEHLAELSRRPGGPAL